MAVLRATQRLSRALGVKLDPAGPSIAAPSLSEWYGNIVPTRSGELVVLVNAPTRLTLVSRAVHPVRLVHELPQRLTRLLEFLELPPAIVQREARELASVRFEKTVDRRLIGSLNEVCHEVASEAERRRPRTDGDLERIENDMAAFVHLTMPETFPDVAVYALFDLECPPKRPALRGLDDEVERLAAPRVVRALRLVPDAPPVERTDVQATSFATLLGADVAEALARIARHGNVSERDAIAQLVVAADADLAKGSVDPSTVHDETLTLPGEVRGSDLLAPGIEPLPLQSCGMWDPHGQEWGEEPEYLPEWSRSIIAAGKRPCFEMQRVPHDDPDDNSIIAAIELSDAGDRRRASALLHGLLVRDARWLDAHAHLGSFSFDKRPADALAHYMMGAKIGALSLHGTRRPVLPWALTDNRPFLRCVNGVALCLWRLRRHDEAARIFSQMLWLNPNDNQGARFNLVAIEANQPWRPD